jgi:hypothetical protein
MTPDVTLAHNRKATDMKNPDITFLAELARDHYTTCRARIARVLPYCSVMGVL